ncbi:MFS transporter, partial [Thermodesulfobacteriota bacterium]
GFVGLAVTMFLFSFLILTIVLNIHKLAGVWFSGRQVVLANGIVCVGVGMGAMMGAMISNTVLSPLLGGWKNVLFAYGVLSVIFGFIWCMTRSGPSQEGSDHNGKDIPFLQAFLRVIQTKGVWRLALVHLCYMACMTGTTGYLPLYLRNIGFSPESADGALAALKGAGMLAAIPLTIISSRFSLKKGMLTVIFLVAMVSVYSLSVADNILIWPLVVLIGMFHDGYVAIILTMVMETEGIGAVYAGTAIGLVFSLGSLGSFLSPLAGNAMAGIDPGLPFVFWGSFAIISIIFLYLPAGTRKET